MNPQIPPALNQGGPKRVSLLRITQQVVILPKRFQHLNNVLPIGDCELRLHGGPDMVDGLRLSGDSKMIKQASCDGSVGDLMTVGVCDRSAIVDLQATAEMLHFPAGWPFGSDRLSSFDFSSQVAPKLSGYESRQLSKCECGELSNFAFEGHLALYTRSVSRAVGTLSEKYDA